MVMAYGEEGGLLSYEWVYAFTGREEKPRGVLRHLIGHWYKSFMFQQVKNFLSRAGAKLFPTMLALQERRVVPSNLCPCCRKAV